MFLSYLEPPGADGGLYGSGCFHFINNFSVSVNRSCKPNQYNFLIAHRKAMRTL